MSALGKFRLYPRPDEWDSTAAGVLRLIGPPFFPQTIAPLPPSRFRLFLAPGSGRTREGLAWTSTGGPFLLAFAPTAASIRRALVAALGSDPGVVAVVGERVFPGLVPLTAALPSITYQVVSIARDQPRDLAGLNLIARARVQIAAVSSTLVGCEAVAEAVRQALDAFRGDLGGTGVTVVETTAGVERDLHEDPADGSTRPIYRTVLDYSIRYREPRPSRLL